MRWRPSATRRSCGEAFQALDGADIVILAVGLLGERGGLPGRPGRRR